ncbi:unnamed protein product [Pseudo-nitzschia multistriata]|uniref:Uncharacterized protein n=1 Tax=Pseudo-nitzschia multistriata TaxID=183589 RepID=A0A448Z2X9_9STRA|nr:unnamed protein product [Pseudo-nitzschia multistriata]
MVVSTSALTSASTRCFWETSEVVDGSKKKKRSNQRSKAAVFLHRKRVALSWATAMATMPAIFSPWHGPSFAEAFASPGQRTQQRSRGTTRRAANKTEMERVGTVHGKDVSELYPENFSETMLRNVFGFGNHPQWKERVTYTDANGIVRPPLDSMTGRVVVITGASSGLGLETAKRLAMAGATVVLTARTADRVRFAVNAVRDYCRGRGNGNNERKNMDPVVRGIELDLDDLSSVRSFPDRYKDCLLSLSKITDRAADAKAKMKRAKEGRKSIPPPSGTKPIDVLVNNAGAGGFPSRELTVDGFERTFQSCYLGHFLLTASLFGEGLLKENDGEGEGCCTVINVSSLAHRGARASHGEGSEDAAFGFDFENIQSEIAYTDDVYSQSKLANIMFTKELDRRASGRLRSVSLHPGIIASDMWRCLDSFGYDTRSYNERLRNGERLGEQPAGMGWMERVIISPFYFSVMTPVEQGANCHVYLAYAAATDFDGESVQSGQHYGEFGTPEPTLDFASDEDSLRRLWEVSEELAGIRFDPSC